uniref:Carbohydrate-binding module 48-containing protein n=1 Tax=Trepomonas sp. PC1 TaxID=1076344 RepID=A0A146KI88_9EUKA|eukprot:JAP95848.1 Carbohydrate-binding module 48-containing protein [Trepomonas sp. PC1]
MEQVLFTWNRPGKDVKIAGDFSNWQPIDMQHQDFVWKQEQQLTYGLHRFKFVVDGQWVCDDSIQKELDNYFNWNNVIQVAPKSPMRKIRQQ